MQQAHDSDSCCTAKRRLPNRLVELRIPRRSGRLPCTLLILCFRTFYSTLVCFLWLGGPNHSLIISQILLTQDRLTCIIIMQRAWKLFSSLIQSIPCVLAWSREHRPVLTLHYWHLSPYHQGCACTKNLC